MFGKKDEFLYTQEDLNRFKKDFVDRFREIEEWTEPETHQFVVLVYGDIERHFTAHSAVETTEWLDGRSRKTLSLIKKSRPTISDGGYISLNHETVAHFEEWVGYWKAD